MDLDELEREVLGDETENVGDETPAIEDVSKLGDGEIKKPEPTNVKKPDINVNELAKTIEQQKQELEELKQFKNHIIGNTDVDPTEEERSKFMEDPYDFYNKKLDNKVNEVRQEILNRDIVRQVNESTKELEREYEVDWSKDQDRINTALNMFSKDVKQSDPKGALRKAFILAGIKHKDNVADLGYTETGISQKYQDKKSLDEAQQIKKNIMEVKNSELDFI